MHSLDRKAIDIELSNIPSNKNPKHSTKKGNYYTEVFLNNASHVSVTTKTGLDHIIPLYQAIVT